MANVIYENYVLANEIEDQFDSHLDLARFCTIDKSLEGVAGMKKVINRYSATDGTEKLAMGAGNTKSIETSFAPVEYEILLAQNRFQYFDEEAMKDPIAIETGIRHMGTDMFNTANADIFAEFNKATLSVPAAAPNFDAFVDMGAKLNVENLEGLELFAFVNPADMASIRKALKDELKYVEAFANQGYVGTVAGWNLYIKKDAVPGTIVGGTKEAVTLFNKKGVEIEQERDANIRKNSIWSRKYYLAALTDATKVVKITLGA
jgi:hypothetical protein